MTEPTDADVARARAWLILNRIPTSGLALSLAKTLAGAREEGRREERGDILALMDDRRLGGLTISGLREEIAARAEASRD